MELGFNESLLQPLWPLRMGVSDGPYESIKEKGALMVIPSGMGHSIDPGVLGMALSSTQMKPEDDSLDVA